MISEISLSQSFIIVNQTPSPRYAKILSCRRAWARASRHEKLLRTWVYLVNLPQISRITLKSLQKKREWAKSRADTNTNWSASWLGLEYIVIHSFSRGGYVWFSLPGFSDQVWKISFWCTKCMISKCRCYRFMSRQHLHEFRTYVEHTKRSPGRQMIVGPTRRGRLALESDKRDSDRDSNDQASTSCVLGIRKTVR